ncbi:tetratricopeptide repeat protein [Agrobacterium sp. Azo12]|jgi:tetratricopeptide (TPR) repeat protein|uniref:tetratricopeptide repeat protein n=1 Tax=Agrobacterium sp. Azo12 TaxID=3031129 RepID=UPI0023D893D8|nr:tetratricopeptide repeat protein [Agrobacterium sp. Azo12]MDO5896724.1 hypothetical protein [Agrobacterium sp. Azo12]
MRRFHFYSLFVLPAVFVTAIGSVAFAQDVAPATVAPQQDSVSQTVDSLFDGLKKERNADKGKSIAMQIVGEWADSESPTVNLLTQWAAEAVEDKRKSAAYDFLDQAILLEPEYFEAIFARAQLHLADGDTKKAMADINRVLNDEPRHFLALASMAEILEASGRDELAIKAWERYLDIYPSNREAQKELQDLSEKLAGQRS